MRRLCNFTATKAFFFTFFIYAEKCDAKMLLHVFFCFVIHLKEDVRSNMFVSCCRDMCLQEDRNFYFNFHK